MSIIRLLCTVMFPVLLSSQNVYGQSGAPAPSGDVSQPATGAATTTETTTGMTTSGVSVAPHSEAPPVPQPSVQSGRSKRSLAVVGGGSFQYLFETPFLSGGVEMRAGVLTRWMDITVRLRIEGGSTLSGLPLFKPSLALGLLFPIGSRVRLGVDLTVPPFVRAMLIRYATRDMWGFALLSGLGAEMSIDLVKWEGDRALFLVGTIGIDLTSVRPDEHSQNTVTVGPNVWVGLGYRF